MTGSNRRITDHLPGRTPPTIQKIDDRMVRVTPAIDHELGKVALDTIAYYHIEAAAVAAIREAVQREVLVDLIKKAEKGRTVASDMALQFLQFEHEKFEYQIEKESQR